MLVPPGIPNLAMTKQPLSPFQQKRLDLLAAVAGWPATTSAAPPPPVSAELDQLLWLYAEDAIDEADERRLWELAAREPGVATHFRALVARLAHHEAAAAAPLPEQVMDKLGLTPLPAAATSSATSPANSPATTPANSMAAARAAQKPAQRGSQSALWGGVVLRVARDFLDLANSSLDSFALAGAARSAAERPTTFTSENQLTSAGIFKVQVNHVGEGRCDVALRVELSSESHPVSSLLVELRDARDTLLQSARFASSAAWFRNLEPGQYVLAILDGGQELDRVRLTLDTH